MHVRLYENTHASCMCGETRGWPQESFVPLVQCTSFIREDLSLTGIGWVTTEHRGVPDSAALVLVFTHIPAHQGLVMF